MPSTATGRGNCERWLDNQLIEIGYTFIGVTNWRIPADLSHWTIYYKRYFPGLGTCLWLLDIVENSEYPGFDKAVIAACRGAAADLGVGEPIWLPLGGKQFDILAYEPWLPFSARA